MPQSLARIPIHLIFSTKGRFPYLTEARIRRDLEAFQSGILHDMDCKAILNRCVTDHAHLLFLLSKNHSLCDVVEEVKKGSSRWLKKQDNLLTRFYWQAGYGAYAVGESELKRVRSYVERQEEPSGSFVPGGVSSHSSASQHALR